MISRFVSDSNGNNGLGLLLLFLLASHVSSDIRWCRDDHHQSSICFAPKCAGSHLASVTPFPTASSSCLLLSSSFLLQQEIQIGIFVCFISILLEDVLPMDPRIQKVFAVWIYNMRRIE